MRLDIFTITGLIGTVIVLIAYFANQAGRLASSDWRFPLANLGGSLLIMCSLITAWNLPSAVIELAWSVISVYGLLRGFARRGA